MEFLPFLPFIAVSVPESIVLYFFGTTLLGYRPFFQKLVTAGVVTSLASYFVRSVTIEFGIHTLIQLIIMIMFFYLFFRLPFLLSVIATLLAAFSLGLVESLFVPLLGWIFGLTIKEIVSSPTFRFLFTMPHLAVLASITYVIYRRGWYLRFLRQALGGDKGRRVNTGDEGNQGNVGDQGDSRPEQARRYYLIIISLLQALMLVFLNLSLYAYNSGVFPTFQLSHMMLSVSIVIIASAVTTLFVANRLIKITNREAKLEADLYHIREMQNLNLKMRSQRHDFYNHITSLYGFIRYGRYDDAKVYMESLYNDIREVKSLLELDPPVLGALLSLKREKAERLEVHFNWHIQMDKKELPLSTQALTQLLGNLLDNAIEAAQSGEPKTVKLEIESTTFGLIIKVANTSKPVTKEVLENVFHPGFSTKSAGEHSGLGLYIVKEIVDRYKGEIQIDEPEDYHGMEMQVFIPLKSTS